MRPTTIEEAAVGPDVEWVARERDRPLVYVTFGTVFNAPSKSFRATVAAVSDFDGCALVTVGPGADTSVFGPLPDRVRVTRVRAAARRARARLARHLPRGFRDLPGDA